MRREKGMDSLLKSGITKSLRDTVQASLGLAWILFPIYSRQLRFPTDCLRVFLDIPSPFISSRPIINESDEIHMYFLLSKTFPN